MAQIIIVNKDKTLTNSLNEGDKITISIKDGDIIINKNQKKNNTKKSTHNVFVSSGTGETNYACGHGAIGKQINTTQVVQQSISGNGNIVPSRQSINVVK